jgi:uncharacterized lipoprotein YddW (UPF0748 family)
MHNEGNYIISLGNLCRWLAKEAESLGVEIYSGVSASEVRSKKKNTKEQEQTSKTTLGFLMFPILFLFSLLAASLQRRWKCERNCYQ